MCFKIYSGQTGRTIGNLFSRRACHLASAEQNFAHNKPRLFKQLSSTILTNFDTNFKFDKTIVLGLNLIKIVELSRLIVALIMSYSFKEIIFAIFRAFITRTFISRFYFALLFRAFISRFYFALLFRAFISRFYFAPLFAPLSIILEKYLSSLVSCVFFPIGCLIRTQNLYLLLYFARPRQVLLFCVAQVFQRILIAEFFSLRQSFDDFKAFPSNFILFCLRKLNLLSEPLVSINQFKMSLVRLD